MGRRGGDGRVRGQQPVDGFRPGKEPEHLRKRRAKERLGEDASWAQEKMIDAVAGRSPDEVRSMVGRWKNVLLAVTVVLLAVGALLYRWSLFGGLAVHGLAVLAGFLWYRLRAQGEQLVQMAEWVRRG